MQAPSHYMALLISLAMMGYVAINGKRVDVHVSAYRYILSLFDYYVALNG